MLLQLDDSPSQIWLVSSTRAANDDIGHILPHNARRSVSDPGTTFPHRFGLN
jgi:hypothetical protein